MKYDKALTAGRLKALRKRRGLSQSQVAAALRIDRSTYAYYELGRTPLPAEKLVFLALYYRVSSDFLLGLSEREAGSQRPHIKIFILLTALLITAPLNAPFCQILGENGAKKSPFPFSARLGETGFFISALPCGTAPPGRFGHEA